MNLPAVQAALDEAVAYARNGRGPAYVECVSTRFYPGDVLEAWRPRCPIETFAAGFGLDLAAARAEVHREMAEVFRPTAAPTAPPAMYEQRAA